MKQELAAWTKNARLKHFISEVIDLCKPRTIHLCDGSEEENCALLTLLVERKTLIPLNPEKRPGSYLCRSDPNDVARVEEATFICSKKKEDAGPTNNWRDPLEMKRELMRLFSGCMKGRTLYVIPFCMGPLGGSELSLFGVQVTDSPYVVVNMRIMTRVGACVLEELGDAFFIPCLHSVGVPLEEGEEDASWPCRKDQKVIAHFPEERSIWSFGSGYGGNALLDKKCLSLRIASVMARDGGWLAEHMLIVGLTGPEGKKHYIAGAFPSMCGKTNLALIHSVLPGWKAECVGDDIAWMKFKEDGRLYAINPEAGLFGVAPGTSVASNPNAMLTLAKKTLFTNTALTPDGDVWWEGMSAPPPALTDWKGRAWTPSLGTPAAHPNARFTAPLSQCPIVDPLWDSPEGVPLSAILFGGRRPATLPLVVQSLSWNHGVLFGAALSSERTAAAKGEVGVLRHDPFAMLPFCGYNMGDYFAHWIKIGAAGDPDKLPKIFSVNWFRRASDGSFLWPGYGDNIRLLKWVVQRCEGYENALKTPVGYVPGEEALDLTSLDISKEKLSELFAVNKEEWLREVDELEEYFKRFEERFPKALKEELAALRERLA